MLIIISNKMYLNLIISLWYRLLLFYECIRKKNVYIIKCIRNNNPKIYLIYKNEFLGWFRMTRTVVFNHSKFNISTKLKPQHKNKFKIVIVYNYVRLLVKL